MSHLRMRCKCGPGWRRNIHLTHSFIPRGMSQSSNMAPLSYHSGRCRTGSTSFWTWLYFGSASRTLARSAKCPLGIMSMTSSKPRRVPAVDELTRSQRQKHGVTPSTHSHKQVSRRGWYWVSSTPLPRWRSMLLRSLSFPPAWNSVVTAMPDHGTRWMSFAWSKDSL